VVTCFQTAADDTGYVFFILYYFNYLALFLFIALYCIYVVSNVRTEASHVQHFTDLLSTTLMIFQSHNVSDPDPGGQKWPKK
jgi:hypothetical protein